MLTTSSPMQIESIVHGKIRAVLAERGGAIGHLTGDEKLNATLGLSSLDLAFLVAELEAELGIDPFAKLVSITSVQSVADLVRAYQQAFFPELQHDERQRGERRRGGEDEALAAAAKRAETRRARRGRG
jgi:acyl carrier protein